MRELREGCCVKGGRSMKIGGELKNGDAALGWGEGEARMDDLRVEVKVGGGLFENLNGQDNRHT